MVTPTYEVRISKAADKELQRLPEKLQKRIVDAAEALEENPRPHGSIKLVGEDDLWRIRVGEYRIVYEIHDDVLIVLVVRIGHRRDIYRK